MNIIASILLLQLNSKESQIRFDGDLKSKVHSLLVSLGSTTTLETISQALQSMHQQYPTGIDLQTLASHLYTKSSPAKQVSAIRPMTRGKLFPFVENGVLKEVWSEINARQVFRIYETPASVVTLFSRVDGSPLMLFELSTPSTAKIMAGLGESPPGLDTQGAPLVRFLLDRDQQTLLPRVHNLTATSLHFLLSREGKVFNQVNFIRPLRSYMIPADQNTGKEMVLQIIRQDDKTGKSTEITTQDDEKNAKLRGLYWQLVVHPAKDGSNHLWKETSWRCRRFFITQENANYEDYPLEDEKMDDGEEDDDEGDGENDYGFSLFDNDEEEIEQVDDEKSKIILPQERTIDTAVVQKSKVCHVTSGQDVTVNSIHNSTKINYELGANCFLHLAVNDKLTVPSPSPLNYHTILSEYLEKKWKDELAPKKFISECCVVCFEKALPSALVTLHPCGHQCLHGHCLQKLTICPLCRSPISVPLY